MRVSGKFNWKTRNSGVALQIYRISYNYKSIDTIKSSSLLFIGSIIIPGTLVFLFNMWGFPLFVLNIL